MFGMYCIARGAKFPKEFFDIQGFIWLGTGKGVFAFFRNYLNAGVRTKAHAGQMYKDSEKDWRVLLPLPLGETAS